MAQMQITGRAKHRLGRTPPECRTARRVAPPTLRSRAISSSFVAETLGTSGTVRRRPTRGELGLGAGTEQAVIVILQAAEDQRALAFMLVLIKLGLLEAHGPVPS